MHKRELIAKVIQEYHLNQMEAAKVVRRFNDRAGRRNEGNWDYIYGQIKEALGKGDDFTI